MHKSLVTLGKPLKFEGTNVYIRDTYLLSPAGSKSLSSLGKLYLSEGDYEKRVIKNQDLQKMGEFLKRDPVAFSDYAVQDAIVTLKHAISMEEFNFSINQLGVPLTLSGLGRNYVM